MSPAVGRFLLRRLLLMAISLVGITLLTFFVLRLAPGDPVSLATGFGGDSAGDLETSDLERDTARVKRELLGMLATHDYRVSARDPDGDRVSLEVDWGDGASVERTEELAPDAAAAGVDLEHSWPAPGEYRVRVRAIDEHGGTSEWSEALVVRAQHDDEQPVPSAGAGDDPVSDTPQASVESSNRPPLVPPPPHGPTEPRVETTMLEQYAAWVGRIVRLDFGESYQFRRDVWTLIWDDRLPRTLILSALSLLVSYLLGIPLGVFAAARPNSLASRSSTVVLFALFALPSFWVATMLIVLVTDWPVFPLDRLSCGDPGVHDVGAGGRVVAMGIAMAVALAVAIRRLAANRRVTPVFAWTIGVVVAGAALASLLKWAPRSDLTAVALAVLAALAAGAGATVSAARGRASSSGAFGTAALATAAILAGLWWASTTDLFWHALLPVICLSYGNLAVISRYARSGMLDVLQQDYIRTARAKGLDERAVILRHGLRGGMIPVLTLIGTVLPALITGSVIVEYVFTIEGTGLLVVQAIQGRDYNVVLAMTTLAAVLTLAGYLLSDILYALADPRVGFGRREA